MLAHVLMFKRLGVSADYRVAGISRGTVSRGRVTRGTARGTARGK